MPIKKKTHIFEQFLHFGILLLIFCMYYTCHGDEIILKEGDVIHGDILSETESSVLLYHEDLGGIIIPKDRILSLKRSTNQVVSPDANMQDIEQKDVNEKAIIFETMFDNLKSLAMKAKKKGYGMAISLSLSETSGNTEENSLRLGLATKRRLPNVKYDSDLTYYYKSKSGETTDNKLTLGASRDRLYEGSKWFFFTLSRYDYDEFESWLHRASAHAGPGYHLIEKDNFFLDVKVGPGVRKEWGSDNTNVKFEGYAGTFLEWKPTKRQTYNFGTAYYPVLSDFGDYRTRTTFDWSFLLSDELNLNFFLGLLHEYQSVVDPGDKKNDTRVYSGIQFKF